MGIRPSVLRRNGYVVGSRGRFPRDVVRGTDLEGGRCVANFSGGGEAELVRLAACEGEEQQDRGKKESKHHGRTESLKDNYLCGIEARLEGIGRNMIYEERLSILARCFGGKVLLERLKIIRLKHAKFRVVSAISFIGDDT